MNVGRRGLLPYRYYNAVIGIILVNGVIFVLSLAIRFLPFELALIPPRLIQGYWWTSITYFFVHSPGSIYHILLNMLGLLWFGAPVERNIGSNAFLLFYLISGVCSGLFASLFSLNSPVAIIGASGAVFAVMLSYAAVFPDSVIYLFWFFPTRAPVAVLIFAGISVFGTLTGFQAGISHLTHLGGFIVGFFYVWIRLGVNPLNSFFHR